MLNDPATPWDHLTFPRFRFWSLLGDGRLGFGDSLFRRTLCALPCAVLFAPAGLHANTTDIMAEMEGFGKGSQLLVASKMIEVPWSFLDGTGGANRQAIQTGAALPYGGGADDQWNPGEDGDEANSGSKLLVDEEVVPADPSEPRSTSHMFMRKMGSLRFPIHKLRGSDGHRLVSQIL